MGNGIKNAPRAKSPDKINRDHHFFSKGGSWSPGGNECPLPEPFTPLASDPVYLPLAPLGSRLRRSIFAPCLRTKLI